MKSNSLAFRNTELREQLQGSEEGEGECTASAQREKRNHIEGMKKRCALVKVYYGEQGFSFTL